MATAIELAKKFLPVLDDVYTAESATKVLDTPSKDFAGANEVKVLKVATTGLGDYSRIEGYPEGDVTAAWETLQLTQERGKQISVDRLDDEETLGMTFGAVAGNFMRDHVIPELDAYRFAKYAGSAGVGKLAGSLTKDGILAAIDEASKALTAAQVPWAGRKLFVSSDLQPVLNQALARSWGSEADVNNVLAGYNGMPIVYVPATRFFTKVKLNDGAAAWGFQKDAAGKNINFLMLHPSAVVQVVKFAMPKIFSPDENQQKDSWLFQFREYHDAFVLDNRVGGVYVHHGA